MHCTALESGYRIEPQPRHARPVASTSSNLVLNWMQHAGSMTVYEFESRYRPSAPEFNNRIQDSNSRPAGGRPCELREPNRSQPASAGVAVPFCTCVNILQIPMEIWENNFDIACELYQKVTFPCETGKNVVAVSLRWYVQMLCFCNGIDNFCQSRAEEWLLIHVLRR